MNDLVTYHYGNGKAPWVFVFDRNLIRDNKANNRGYESSFGHSSCPLSSAKLLQKSSI